jgi:hypothetical protein
MEWLGVPFPYFGGHITELSRLAISHMPDIQLKTDFAWDTFLASVLGAFIAGSIPGAIAWLTIRQNIIALKEDRAAQQLSYDKDREAQLDIASQNLLAQTVSTNRQAWINELRSSAAEYFGKVMRIQMLINDHHRVGGLNPSILDAFDLLDFHSAKIRMLLNPDESEYQVISVIIVHIKVNLVKIRNSGNAGNSIEIAKSLRNFEETIQKICKAEWVKVKSNK